MACSLAARLLGFGVAGSANVVDGDSFHRRSEPRTWKGICWFIQRHGPRSGISSNYLADELKQIISSIFGLVATNQDVKAQAKSGLC